MDDQMNQNQEPQPQPQQAAPQPPVPQPPVPQAAPQQPYFQQPPYSPYQAPQQSYPLVQPYFPQQQPPPIPQKELRKDIRSVCLAVAALVATIAISSGIFMFLYIFIDLLISGAAIEFIEGGDRAIDAYFSSDYMQKSMDSLGPISALSIIVGCLWFFLIRGKRLLTTDITTRREGLTPSAFLLLVALMFGVQFFMMLVNLATLPFFESLDVSATDEMNDAISSLFTTPLGLLYVVIVGPIVEEIAFRGAVMRTLERYGANFAIVTSSLLFGLYHMILFQGIFAFLLGLLLGYAAGRFSIKWAMVLHVINNFLACLPFLVGAIASSVSSGGGAVEVVTATEITSVVMFFVYLAGFILTIVFLITKRDMLKTQKRVGAPAFRGVFGIAYSHPIFIVFLAVFGLLSILSL